MNTEIVKIAKAVVRTEEKYEATTENPKYFLLRTITLNRLAKKYSSLLNRLHRELRLLYPTLDYQAVKKIRGSLVERAEKWREECRPVHGRLIPEPRKVRRLALMKQKRLNKRGLVC